MKKWILLVALTLGFSARAYHINEHRSITNEAFQELTTCFPRAQSLLNVRWMAAGDVDEDLDLVTKWLFYSHYYNPNKALQMRRSDSSVRVQDLSVDLRHPVADDSDGTEMTNLGHMIHHYQDATVPSHVVPVDHSMWDGFETYKVQEFSSGLNCDQIAALDSADALTILKETALATLNNIQIFQFEFVSEADGVQNRVLASGPAFWQESNDNSFGRYGYLGNHFGDVNFRKGPVRYQIADVTYQTFKKRQLQLATIATIRGLMWELGDQLKKTQTVCSSASRI